MRENSYERLRRFESSPVHVICLLRDRVKYGADPCPERLPPNDYHRGLKNTHDLAKVALTVLHHRPRRRATHPAISRNGRAEQVVGESKSIENVNALALNHHKFRIVVGTERNAEEQPKHVRGATHVRIPSLVAAFGLKPAIKA